MHGRLVTYLEEHHGFDRTLAILPTQAQWQARQSTLMAHRDIGRMADVSQAPTGDDQNRSGPRWPPRTRIRKRVGARLTLRELTMTIELIPLGTADVGISEPIMMPGGPLGTRAIIEITSAEYSGERLRAKLKGVAAADWAVVSPAGVGLMDVRLTIETDDGALIYVSYGGRVDLSTGVEGATVYTAPRFETGDERYAWINKIQAVAKGVINGGVLRYEIYEMR